MKKLIYSLLLIFVLPSMTLAANKHIRAGASGDGSDWTNAYGSFAAVASAGWSRSNTYYVAGGTYSEDVTITPSGTTPFTIKKATVSDHGSETGWSASYASDQAIINGKLSLGSYITFDGSTGSGVTGHGIRIYNDNATYPSASVFMASGITDVYLNHLDIAGPGSITNLAGGIYWSSSSSTAKLRVSNCWIHDCGFNGVTIQNAIGTDYGDNYGLLFENNFVSEAGLLWLSNEDSHAQGMQIGYNGTTNYLIIRNNTFRNIVSNAAISFMGLASHQNALIYNNLFYFSDMATYPGCAYLIWMSESSMGTVDSIGVYNNTVYGWGTSSGTVENSLCTALDTPYTFCTGLRTGTYTIKAFLSFPSAGTNIVARNNLWVSSYLSSANVGVDTASNNGYYDNSGGADPGDTETSSPFTNSAAYDFTLKATANAVNTGYDLSAIFTTDIVGTTRTGGFDIGAYEYGQALVTNASGCTLSGASMR